MTIVGLDGKPLPGGEDSFEPWTLAKAIEAIQPAIQADALILVTMTPKGFKCAAKFPDTLEKHQVLELTKRIQKLTRDWLKEVGMIQDEPEEEEEE